MMPPLPYAGRFAPSPSGPLHAGSLCAALGSWLDARAQGGQWYLRVEDLDTPRNAPGAENAILACLEAHGLHWDGAVLRQSERLEHYASALDRLRRADLAYPCGCSRRSAGESGGVYPGTCRHGLPAGRRARAWRLRCPEGMVRFVDRACGDCAEDVAIRAGDFVIKRADGIFAYQLAVVVDDAAQGITHVVRGRDLLDSTARQCLLQQLLDYPRPAYLHLPLVLGEDGQKLSKQNLAPALDPRQAAGNLLIALERLGQATPPWRPARDPAPTVREVLAWALAHWRAPGAPTLGPATRDAWLTGPARQGGHAAGRPA